MTTRRRTTLTATLTAAALLLTACDGGGEQDGTAADAPADVAPPAGADAATNDPGGAAVQDQPAPGRMTQPDRGAAAEAAAPGAPGAGAPTTTETTMTTSAPADGVTVSGTGTAAGTPDVLRATVGVSVTRDRVAAALEAANAAAADVVAALREAGLGDDDLQTTRLSVQPRYGRPPQDGGEPPVTGYTADNLVEARITDLDGAGGVLQEAVVAAGDAARLQGVHLEVSDDDALLADARRAAFAAARDTAEQYAELTGRPLGDLVSVAETSSAPPPPRPLGMEAATADAAIPIEPGRQEVSVTVTAVWAFG